MLLLRPITLEWVWLIYFCPANKDMGFISPSKVFPGPRWSTRGAGTMVERLFTTSEVVSSIPGEGCSQVIAHVFQDVCDNRRWIVHAFVNVFDTKRWIVRVFGNVCDTEANWCNRCNSFEFFSTSNDLKLWRRKISEILKKGLSKIGERSEICGNRVKSWGNLIKIWR